MGNLAKRFGFRTKKDIEEARTKAMRELELKDLRRKGIEPRESKYKVGRLKRIKRVNRKIIRKVREIVY